MSLLIRAVGGNHVVLGGGAEPVGQERRRSRDEAVQNHGAPHRRPAQYNTGQHADLESSHFGEHVQGIAGVGPVDRQCPMHYFHLVFQLLGGASRAPAGGFPGGSAGEVGRDGAGGGGVADAHVARGDQVRAGASGLDRKIHPCRETPFRLPGGHGGSLSNVFRAVSGTQAAEIGMIPDSACHSRVHDDPSNAQQP